MIRKVARYEITTLNANCCKPVDIDAILKNRGAVIVNGVPKSVAGLLAFGRSIGEIVKHPHSDANGITTIFFNPELGKLAGGGLGFLNSELILHTDRSSDNIPPDYVVVMCVDAGETGGLSKLSDTQPILDFMKVEFPEEYIILHSTSCVFGDTMTRSSVVSYLRQRSILRFRFDHLGFYPPPAWNAIRLFLKLAEESSYTFPLAPGQLYVADNHRVLHGRTAYSGSRKMLRLLVNSNESFARSSEVNHE